MGFKPIPHRHAVRAFLPGPLGVAHTISACPGEVKMSSILRRFAYFSHEWLSRVLKCTHQWCSFITFEHHRVPLSDAWTTRERSRAPMHATHCHF